MSEKPEAEEFDDDEAEEVLESSDEVDVDRVMRDMDQARRRGGPKLGDPAWRRLERKLEEKRTAELTSDFDDYDVGLEPAGARGAKRRGSQRSA
jgi:hypothetical protein